MVHIMQRCAGRAVGRSLLLVLICVQNAAAAGGGGGEISVDWNLVAVLTIFAVIFLSFALGQLDRHVRDYKHTRKLVNVTYKELMILGLVSFGLFAVQSNKNLALDEDSKHLFELIHMTLFLVSLLYAAFIGVIMLLSRNISLRWEAYEALEFRRYRDLKRQHAESTQKLGMHSKAAPRVLLQARALLLHPMQWRRWRELARHVKFHELRGHFIHQNRLPDNFHFVTYLKKCKQHVALSLVKVNSTAWVACALALSADLYVKNLSAQYNLARDLQGFFVACSIAIICMSLLIWAKMTSIMEKLLHSELKSESLHRSDSMHGTSGTGKGLVDGEFFRYQKSFFWFGKPTLIISLLQMLQFLLAVSVAMLIEFGDKLSKGSELGVSVVVIAVALAVYIAALPRVIPTYTMVTHVGDMVDRRRLSEALVKQQKKFHARAIPPTLRQATLLAQLRDRKRSPTRKVQDMLTQHWYKRFRSGLVVLDFFVIAYNNRYVLAGKSKDWAFAVECVMAAFFVIEALLATWAYGLRYVTSVLHWPVIAVPLLRLAFTVSTGVLLRSTGGGGTTAAVTLHALQAVVLLRLLPHLYVSHALRRLTHGGGRGREEEEVGSGSGNLQSSRHLPKGTRRRAALLDETKTLLGKQADPKALAALSGAVPTYSMHSRQGSTADLLHSPSTQKQSLLNLDDASSHSCHSAVTVVARREPYCPTEEDGNATAATAGSSSPDTDHQTDQEEASHRLAYNTSGSYENGSGVELTAMRDVDLQSPSSATAVPQEAPALSAAAGSNGEAVAPAAPSNGYGSSVNGGDLQAVEEALPPKSAPASPRRGMLRSSVSSNFLSLLGRSRHGPDGSERASGSQAALPHNTYHGQGSTRLWRQHSQQQDQQPAVLTLGGLPETAAAAAAGSNTRRPRRGMRRMRTSLSEAGDHSSGEEDEQSSELRTQAVVNQHWETTCREHPDIATVYGKLSAPILRLMLGMTPFDEEEEELRRRTSSSSGDGGSSSDSSDADEEGSSDERYQQPDSATAAAVAAAGDREQELLQRSQHRLWRRHSSTGNLSGISSSGISSGSGSASGAALLSSSMHGRNREAARHRQQHRLSVVMDMEQPSPPWRDGSTEEDSVDNV